MFSKMGLRSSSGEESLARIALTLNFKKGLYDDILGGGEGQIRGGGEGDCGGLTVRFWPSWHCICSALSFDFLASWSNSAAAEELFKQDQKRGGEVRLEGGSWVGMELGAWP